MKRVERAITVISAISVWTGNVISLAALAMMAIIIYDVVARYVFMAPTIWADETNRFILTAYFLLGGAYCIYYNAHVRMDVLYDRLSSRGRAIMDLCTSLVFFTIIIMLLWYSSQAAWQAIVDMERTESAWAPLTFPLKIMAPLGCLLMLLQGAAEFARNVILVATGRELKDISLERN